MKCCNRGLNKFDLSNKALGIPKLVEWGIHLSG